MTASPTGAAGAPLFATTDLCDAHGDAVQVVEPRLLQPFGGRRHLRGPMVTLKVFEDNALVRSALEGPGDGAVLVVDGGGSLRCALVGGQLGQLAEKNGWAGVVVHGCVRDARELFACPVGVWAMATCPRKSVKRGLGDRAVPVSFGGVTFVTGHHLYADEDGVVVAATDLLADAPAVR
jgi:regulator of ribonuclease activity A